MARKRKKHHRRDRRPKHPPASASVTPATPQQTAPAAASATRGWWQLEALACGMLIGLLGLALFFWPTAVGVAGAVKSPGRSYSAGSGSKPPSTSSGKSYSSGSKPSPSPSSGSKYSAGGKPSPAPRPSAKPSPPPVKPSSPPVKVGKPPAPPPLPPSKPAGKSGSVGTGRSYGKQAATNPSAGTKPSGSYDTDAGRAQRHEESRAAYEKAQQPRTTPTPTRPTPPPTYPRPSPPPRPPLPPPPPVYRKGEQPQSSYTDANGTKRDIDAKDARIESLRRQLDEERWANRKLREEQAYRNYTSPPSVVLYNDPYHTLLNYWLMQRAAEERARWVYNHRDSMDPRRYQDLREKDRQLEERVRELEATQTPREPAYTPKGIDPDLVYNERYAEAAYNPKKVESPPPEPEPTVPQPPRPSILLRVLTVLGLVALFAFVVWLVFIKRWGGDV